MRLRPESPDLEALAAAREPYLAALRATISGLRTLGVSWVAAAHRLGQQRQCAGGGADPEQATGPVDDHRGEDVVGAQVEWRIGPEGPAVGGTAAGAEVLPHDRQAELGVGPGAAADAPCPADCRGAGGVLVDTRIEQTGDSLAFHQRGVQRVGLTPLEPTQPLARMSGLLLDGDRGVPGGADGSGPGLGVQNEVGVTFRGVGEVQVLVSEGYCGLPFRRGWSSVGLTSVMLSEQSSAR